MTGIPITNVNNNCSTGSTALFNANSFIRGGQAECALALGFERMAPGSLKSNWSDRDPPQKPWAMMTEMTEETLGKNHGPGAPRMFGNGGQEYFDKYGGNIETLAKIGTDIQIKLLYRPPLIYVPQHQRTTSTPLTTHTPSSEMVGVLRKFSRLRRSRINSQNSCAVRPAMEVMSISALY